MALTKNQINSMQDADLRNYVVKTMDEFFETKKADLLKKSPEEIWNGSAALLNLADTIACFEGVTPDRAQLVWLAEHLDAVLDSHYTPAAIDYEGIVDAWHQDIGDVRFGKE